MKFSSPIGKLARATNAPAGSVLLIDANGSRALVIVTNYVDDGEPMNVLLSSNENFQGLVTKRASDFWAWDVTKIAEIEVDYTKSVIGSDRPPFGAIACDKEGHSFIAVDPPGGIARNNWIDLEQFKLATPDGGTTVRFSNWSVVIRGENGDRAGLFNWPTA